MVEIRRYTTNDKQRWDEFVTLSKNATFLHYRDYMDYHSDRFNDHSLMAFNEKGKLIALLPANADGDTLYSHQGLTFSGWLTQVKHFNANNMLEIFDSMCDYLKSNGFHTLIYKAIPHIYHKYPAEEDLYALFPHKLKSRQFIQNPLGSFVQIFVHINQTAGQLHIMEDFTLFFSGTFNQQDFQLLSVKTNHHTVYRNMIVCQWRILFHVLHNIFV